MNFLRRETADLSSLLFLPLLILHLFSRLSLSSHFRSRRFIMDLIPSHSIVSNTPTVLNNIHSVFAARSSAFNQDLFRLSMNACRMTEFCQKFRAWSSFLNSVQVLRKTMRLLATPAVHIRKIWSAKVGKQKTGAVFKSMFGGAESSVPGELETEKVPQVLKTALSIGIKCDSNARVANMIRTVFKTNNCLSRTLSSSASFCLI